METPIKKPMKPKGQSKEDALDNKKPVSDCGRSKTATQKNPRSRKGQRKVEKTAVNQKPTKPQGQWKE